MKLDHAAELKADCLRRSYEELNLDVGLRANGLAVEPILGRQLSVGFSRRAADDYHLELRLDRANGNAYQAAAKIQAKSPNEIHVGVLETLVVPTPLALANATKISSLTSVYARQGRPLHIGLSISNLNGGVGTLGAFVETAAGEVAIISNCHVLAPPTPGA